MAEGKPGETLVAFVSGHYKKIRGKWAGDAVWSHFEKADGGFIHVNKDKVEYTESFGLPTVKAAKPKAGPEEARLRAEITRAEIAQIKATTAKIKGETNYDAITKAFSGRQLRYPSSLRYPKTKIARARLQSAKKAKPEKKRSHAKR